MHSTWEASPEHTEWTLSQAHSHTVWQVLDAPNLSHISRSPLLCTQNPGETSAQTSCVGSVTVPSAFLDVQNSCRNRYPDQAIGHQYTLDKYPKSSFSAQAKFLDRDKGHVKTKQRGCTTAQFWCLTTAQTCHLTTENNGKMHKSHCLLEMPVWDCPCWNIPTASSITAIFLSKDFNREISFLS